MKIATIHLPETLDIDERDIVMYLCATYFEDGKLSLAEAAELVGVTNRIYMESLSKLNYLLKNPSNHNLV